MQTQQPNVANDEAKIRLNKVKKTPRHADPNSVEPFLKNHIPIHLHVIPIFNH